MRAVLLALAALLGLLVPAGPAAAADPIMPLSDVRAGMRCTGYSVVRGTDIAAFDVEVLDVVAGDPLLDGPRVLVRASGPAVDATGIGPGFSGSPIYCPDATGTPRSTAAISESIGDWGGDVVLAQPMEAIVSTPVDAPGRPRARSGPAGRSSRLPAGRIRPLAAPLTVSGASAPLARLLASAGRRAGRPVQASPAGPLGSFPVQPLRPGAAMAVGYSTGDLAVSAVGTVAYVDGDRVWGFGHPFEGGGERALLLQDAYVFQVIGNPNAGETGGTYKLAAPGHAVGTLSHDGLSAVVGRLGALPSLVPVRVRVHDEDTGARHALALRAADETDVEYPVGPSLPFVAPLAVAQAVTSGVRTTQPKLSGRMCARIAVREHDEPMRFCRRYVGGSFSFEEGLSTLASDAATDLAEALGLIQDFERARLHVTSVRADLDVVRGRRELILRELDLPRRVRPGQTVTARLRVQPVRGEPRTLRVRWRVPRSLRPGERGVVVRGATAEEGDDLLEGFAELLLGEEDAGGGGGPESVEGVARAVSRLGRFDGLVVRTGGTTARFHRDPEWVITGRARDRVRVVAQSPKR